MGISRELYETISTIVDDKIKDLKVRREDFDALRDDLRGVSHTVDGIAKSQTETEARLSRLEAVMIDLAEAQKRTAQSLTALTEAQLRTDASVMELREAQTRTELRLAELAEAQLRTDASVVELREAQTRTELKLGELAEAQLRTDASVMELREAQTRTEMRLAELAEAQLRTDASVMELREAQTRTELKLGELAEAQLRTDASVMELREAQTRTEMRLAELAEAQLRTDASVVELREAQTRTELKLGELAEAQLRTDTSVAILAEAHKLLVTAVHDLRVQVGRLSDTIGFGLEDIAIVMIPGYLQRHHNITVEFQKKLIRLPNKQEIEIDLFGEGKKDGQPIIVIGETRARIKKGDVIKFDKRTVPLVQYFKERNIEVLKTMLGYWIHPDAQTEAQSRDMIVIASYQR